MVHDMCILVCIYMYVCMYVCIYVCMWHSPFCKLEQHPVSITSSVVESALTSTSTTTTMAES